MNARSVSAAFVSVLFVGGAIFLYKNLTSNIDVPPLENPKNIQSNEKLTALTEQYSFENYGGDDGWWLWAKVPTARQFVLIRGFKSFPECVTAKKLYYAGWLGMNKDRNVGPQASSKQLRQKRKDSETVCTPAYKYPQG